MTLLEEFLSERYELVVIENIREDISNVDLLIIDEKSLEANLVALQLVKKKLEPVFLPVLLFSIEESLTHNKLRLWGEVSDIIHIPVEKRELISRIEVLLYARKLSLEAIEHKNLLTLINEKETIQKTFNSVPVPVFSLDSTGKIKFLNNEAKRVFFDYIAGDSFLVHESQEISKKRQEAFENAVMNYQKVVLYERYREKECIISFSPLKTEKKLNVIVSITDITVINNVNKFLKVKNEMLLYLVEKILGYNEFYTYSRKLFDEKINCFLLSSRNTGESRDFVALIDELQKKENPVEIRKLKERSLLPAKYIKYEYITFFDEHLKNSDKFHFYYMFFTYNKPSEELIQLMKDLVLSHRLVTIYVLTEGRVKKLQHHTEKSYNRIFDLVDNIRNHLASIQLASHKCEKESEKNISKAIESIVEFVNYIEKNWKELERIKEEQKLN